MTAFRLSAALLLACTLAGCAQIRPTLLALSTGPSHPVRQRHGTPVYSAEECIGPIVAGTCHGSILPKTAYRVKCYGKMLHGRCTGPMF